MANPRNLRERLIWARKAAGFSQRGLADRAKLADRHVGLIESGERKNLTTNTVCALAAALGVTAGWLMGGEGEQPSEKHLRAQKDER